MRITGLLVVAALVLAAASSEAKPLDVVATLPDLGSLAREVGGDEVSVTVLGKGPQDPHFIEARPSFIRKLHSADLFVVVGMELELGWAPVLLRGARNPRITPGAPGYLDASTVIVPLQVPEPTSDRSAGDLHPFGNPHYLLDPLNGLRVARLIRDRLTELRPDAEPAFRQGYDGFARRLIERLVGPEAAALAPPEELARLVETGRLDPWLEQRGTSLGGWLADAKRLEGSQAVEDHRLWVYFASRFGIRLVGTLEPLPGIAPTSRHLSKVVARIREGQVPLILSTSYFDPRHARWVAQRSGARIAALAHQPGAREGTNDYLATADYNLQQVLEALGEPAP
jgi:ABC-type Zn uptake system ZnuABC Zn-binding protein ZnuA